MISTATTAFARSATKSVRWWSPVAVFGLIALPLILAACTGENPGQLPADAAPTRTAQPTTSPDTSSPDTSSPGTSSPDLTSPSSTVGQAGAAPGVDKLLVVVAENRSAEDVAAHMPFLMSQSRAYGSATTYYAITHPSLPNYLVLAGGSMFGVEDDEDPATHQLPGPSVFGQLIANGYTAKTYAEAMPSNCALRNDDTYAVRHNPWTYFSDPDERAACRKFNVPAGSPNTGPLATDITSGNLPTFGLLIPDDCHNGHDCPTATTDGWLRSWLPAIKNGPDFRSGHLAVIITWDEDDNNAGNRVAVVAIHPALKGLKVTTRLDHYALSNTVSRMSDARGLRDASNAPDLLNALGLR